MSEQEYKYAMCQAGCGCLWRNNGDGTMSLAGPNSKSCPVCEFAAWDELTPITVHQPEPARIIELAKELVKLAKHFADKSEQQTAQTCEIGIYGKHWDGPNATRPEPVQPKDDALSAALDNLVHDNYERSQCGSRNRQSDAELIRYALARNQQHAPRPASTAIPTSERLPTEADADCDGNVWWYSAVNASWARGSVTLIKWAAFPRQEFTHWQPTNLKRPPAPGEEG